MTDKDCDPQTHEWKDESVVKLGGPEGRKTLDAACHADADGRYAYAALEALKFEFYDVPRYQFSAGKMPKPIDTPIPKSTDSKDNSSPPPDRSSQR